MGGVWSNQQMVEARSKEIINACLNEQWLEMQKWHTAQMEIQQCQLYEWHTTQQCLLFEKLRRSFEKRINTLKGT